MTLFEIIKQIFYPDRCIFCKSDIELGTKLLVCPKCADNMMMASGRGRIECEGHIRFCFAPFSYEDNIRDAILKFKFYERMGYADTFAAFIGLYADMNFKDEKPDMIVSVPISEKKKKARGYNQSELLALALSKRIGVPYNRYVLVKKFDTDTQSTLKGKVARMANVMDAFSCPMELGGRNILLVDDIYTTGATADSCARALKVAGAGEIFVASIANKNLSKRMKKLPVIIEGKNVKIKA